LKFKALNIPNHQYKTLTAERIGKYLLDAEFLVSDANIYELHVQMKRQADDYPNQGNHNLNLPTAYDMNAINSTNNCQNVSVLEAFNKRICLNSYICVFSGNLLSK